jgi:hypothetical protein
VSLVQARSSNGAFASSTSGAIVMSSNVTAGSLLLGGWRAGSSTSWLGLSDSANGAYTDIGTDYDVGVARSRIAYRLNSAGAADTVTFSWTPAATPRGHVLEFSQIQTSGAFDQTANATGTGTALTAGAVTITISTNTEFVFGWFNVNADVTFSAASGWTLVSGTNSPDTRTCFVYQEVNSSGTYTPAVNASSSVTWLGQTASFRSTNTASATAHSAPIFKRPTRVWRVYR